MIQKEKIDSCLLQCGDYGVECIFHGVEGPQSVLYGTRLNILYLETSVVTEALDIRRLLIAMPLDLH